MSQSRATSWKFLLAAMLATTSVGTAGASTVWTNATADNDFSNAGNWSGGLPSSTVDAVFGTDGVTTSPLTGTVNVPTAQSFKYISFGNTADTPTTGFAYTFNGAGSLTQVNRYFQSTTDQPQVFNVPFINGYTGSNLRIEPEGGGALTFNAGFTMSAANRAVEIRNGEGSTVYDGSGAVTFNGGVTGGTTAKVSLSVLATNANVTLTGNNTFNGAVTMNSVGGKLYVTSSNALGAGGAADDTAVLGATSTGKIVLSGGISPANEFFSFASRNGAALHAPQISSGSGTNTITNIEDLTASVAGDTVTFSADGTNPGDLFVVAANYNHKASGHATVLEMTGTGNGNWQGNITASAGNWDILKTGSGTWQSGGNNYADGNVNVQGGTLNFTGTNVSLNYTVDAGAKLLVNGNNTIDANVQKAAVYNISGTLGGSGSITSPVAANVTTTTVNMLAGSSLSPGNSAGTLTMDLGATGVLDLTGLAGLGGGGLKFELGTTSDLVNITSGAMSIGTGQLRFSDFTFTQGSGFTSTTYVLFSNVNAIGGTLDLANASGSLGGGYTGTLQIVGSNLDLVVTAVPEPSSFVLAGFGAVGLIAAVRRRRQS